MTEYIRPDVTPQLWVEKPDAAEALMNSASEEAASWEGTGWLIAGGILSMLITNLVVRFGGGPFSGILDLALKVLKKPAPDRHETSPPE